MPADQERLDVSRVSRIAEVESPITGELVKYTPADASPEVMEALVGIVPDDMRITLVLVRRVNGVPHYRYLSNGNHEETFQPWSSTKFMAIANAGSRLRELTNGEVGLTAHTGSEPIGDLVSVVHNYDERDYPPMASPVGFSTWGLETV